MRIVVTPGEPAGVGPDVVLACLKHQLDCEIILVACPDMLKARATQLGLPLELNTFDSSHYQQSGGGRVSIVPVATAKPCIPGQLEQDNASYVLQTLHHAHELCLHQHANAFITGPVHKSVLHNADQQFLGHTEYLAKLSGIQDVLMCFYHPELIIALTTTHIPLKTVCSALTSERIYRSLELLKQGCENVLRITDPRIGVLGINPHAGEAGKLGADEERIHSALAKFHGRTQGPMAADTAFIPSLRQNIDAYLAMYHDQGLLPIKTLYFNQVVNVTLGLPYLRTSVDHGTACHLAGTGKACHASMQNVLSRTLQLLKS